MSAGASTSICSVLGLYLATIYIISMKNGSVDQVKKQISLMVFYLIVVSLMPGVDFYGHLGSFISGSLIGLSFSVLKNDFSEDTLSIKKIKLVSSILYVNYTILELALFLIWEKTEFWYLNNFNQNKIAVLENQEVNHLKSSLNF